MYAQGREALGICDRCAWPWKLSELREETVDGRPSGIKVCPDCFDQDHPQLALGSFPVHDPQSLRNPRPDSSKAESQGLFGWNPVLGLGNTVGAGSVTIAIT